MDIVAILFLFLLAYNNGRKAKQKGLNGILWGFITIVTFIIFESIGAVFVVFAFCQDVIDMNILTKTNGNFEAASKQFNQQFAAAVVDNPLRGLTILLFGIGGYLLIHYILDQKPDKKEPEVNWMDKMNDPTA